MQNSRRDFLRLSGMAGLGGLVTFNAPNLKLDKRLSGGCTLIPTETAGPFPLDLTENAFYFRNDVREDREGVQFDLKVKVIGREDCAPMSNVRVNIWHCDKDGNYSGYGTETGLTYLRGYQFTDANGEASITTIFPGWYPGRVCHIHFQVYVSTAYAVISQMTFDQDDKQALYAEHAAIYTEGVDPLTPDGDGIFSDGYTFQLATITPNLATGGYDGYIEVTVEGSGTTGVGHIEMMNGLHFNLMQNEPNPYIDNTVIPIHIKTPSEVTLYIFDLMGNCVHTRSLGNLSIGIHHIACDMQAMQLSAANYVYQVKVVNEKGTFNDSKMMTIAAP